MSNFLVLDLRMRRNGCHPAREIGALFKQGTVTWLMQQLQASQMWSVDIRSFARKLGLMSIPFRILST